MTDRDALYRAIIENPADDTLRLVYADALEEGGEAERAAFIRAQVELNRLPEYDPRAVQLRAERDVSFELTWESELVLPGGIGWAGEPFRRGLPGAVEVRDGATFVNHADELFTQYPIESLELKVVRVGEVRDLAECSWLARITSLSFPVGTSGQVIRPLLASPHFENLTELRLGSQFTTPSTVSAAVRSKAFRQITSLAVRNDGRAVGTTAGELARLAHSPALKKLDLSSNRLNADVIRALAASGAARSVGELNLSDNNLGAAGVAALAEGDFPALRSLTLLRTRPQPEGVAALVRSGLFRNLRSLSLAGNHLGPAAAFEFADAPGDQLRVLDLRDNRIGDRGAISLADNPRLANLVHLDLSETHLGNAGAEALAESPYLADLVYLNLHDNTISSRAADKLRARFGNRVLLPAPA